MSSYPLRHGPDAHDVQGNVLAAFNKPLATFLLVALPPDVAAARAWLSEVEPLVATTKEVEDFYDRRREPGGKALSATWTGLGLTWHGLHALEPPRDLNRDLAGQWAFRAGPAGRAGDLGDKPEAWLFGSPEAEHPTTIDAVVTVAADLREDLDARQAEVTRIGERHGASVVFAQPGAVLSPSGDGVHREHFGFRDGISQPGVKAFHEPDPEHEDERKGHRGQLLVEPGEFVLGWPREDKQPYRVADWMRNGSFQVLRRLDQDVPAWNEARATAARNGPGGADRWASELIGRTPSGAPLVPHGDPQDNSFDYEEDREGNYTPRSAHIRKAFPREARFAPQRHRLMRRGIPFGAPYRKGETGTRGMVFNAFMSSIERQFEYVQRLFANKPDFPDSDVGPDPLIGQPDPVYKAARTRYAEANPDSPAPGAEPVFESFVKTRGAVYALAPSMRALAWLASGGSNGAFAA